MANDLRRDVERLRREVRELRLQLHRSLKGREIGDTNKPIKLLYTVDNKTGAVAEIDYGDENDDIRIVRKR